MNCTSGVFQGFKVHAVKCGTKIWVRGECETVTEESVVINGDTVYVTEAHFERLKEDK